MWLNARRAHAHTHTQKAELMAIECEWGSQIIQLDFGRKFSNWQKLFSFNGFQCGYTNDGSHLVIKLADFMKWAIYDVDGKKILLIIAKKEQFRSAPAEMWSSSSRQFICVGFEIGPFTWETKHCSVLLGHKFDIAGIWINLRDFKRLCQIFTLFSACEWNNILNELKQFMWLKA